MNLLGGLLNNKSVLNSALGMIRSWMAKDGIHALVIAKSDDLSGDTPGLSVRSYPHHVGIVTGEQDNADVADFMRLREAYANAPADDPDILAAIEGELRAILVSGRLQEQEKEEVTHAL